MRPPAFDRPGRFFRGNLHTHSTASDGRLPAEEVCRRYAGAGYDFLCLSDHFVGLYGYPVSDTTGFRTNRFTTILGAELHHGRMANGEIWHMLAVGLPPEFEPPHSPDFAPSDAGEGIVPLIDRALAAGAFVALAHPEWNGMTPEDAARLAHVHAVEIYNHSCEIETDRGRGIAVWDALLGQGHRLNAIATDDAHFAGPDHFGGWVMVKAEANEPEALLAALKAGAMYSTTGPEIHDMAVEDRRLRIACSPAAHVMAVGAGSAGAVVHGDGLTEAELPLAAFRSGGWLRAVVIDAAGKRAWTNPVWLD